MNTPDHKNTIKLPLQTKKSAGCMLQPAASINLFSIQIQPFDRRSLQRFDYVHVDPVGNLCGAVPEQLRDDLDIHALLKQPRGVCVPEGVNTDLADSSGLAHEIVHIHRPETGSPGGADRGSQRPERAGGLLVPA